MADKGTSPTAREHSQPHQSSTQNQLASSILGLFGFATIDWFRGNNPLSVFQVVVMVQATMATLIDIAIFNWFALRLNKLSIDAVEAHQR